MNTDIVTQLLNGSQNINRMKSEIEQVVKMVIGFADDMSLANHTKICPFVGPVFEATFETADCRWTYSRVLPNKKKLNGDETVYCTVRVNGLTSWIMAPAYSFVGNQHWYPSLLPDVKLVRNCLPVFVEGMMKDVPQMKERLGWITSEA